MNTVELIKNLVKYPAVSGNEKDLINYLKEILSNYGTVETDSMNNVICTFGNGYHVLLDAHIDEIGFVVTSVTDDGFLKLGAVGGIDNRMLLGSEVTVWGKQKVNGIISTLPPHLQKSSDEKKVPDLNEVSVDIGMNKEDALKVISLGDRVTFKRKFNVLLNNQISSNCLDDRAGVAAVINSLDELKKLPVKVTVLFSTQEEVGTRGAKIGPHAKNIDECIAVDVSFGYTPGCDKKDCGEIGKGVMIGYSPILDRENSNVLKNVALECNIPFQQEIMSGRTGTNADVISVCENGIKCSLLSIPLKYMHTPVEVVKVDDVNSVSDLITAYVKKKVGELNA